MEVISLKVYYNSSLWSSKKGICGLPQKVDWEFEYRGAKCFIPYIFRFSKGIVFDIITILDEEKLKEYIDKYESIEEKLTTSERRCAEQEHPYQSVSIKEIWINDNKVDEYSSSSSIYLSSIQENIELKPMKEAYSHILENKASFGYERYYIPYSKADSKIKDMLRFLRLYSINNLKFSTHNTSLFIPLKLQFDMNIKEDTKEIVFEHPSTGTNHTIYFKRGENFEYPVSIDKTASIYAVQSIYEINPPLQDGDSLQFNSSISYTVELDNNKMYNPTSAASIGIIGGADGPSSIFLSSKSSCISVPSFKKEDIAHFMIEGINTNKYDAREYRFKL